MKNLKVIMPILAFISAVLMSFGSADLNRVQSTGYVHYEGNWRPVQVDCGIGQNVCRVKFSETGAPYKVYESDLSTVRTGISMQPILINP